MDTLHSSDGISFSPDFVEPQKFSLISSSWCWQIRSTEYAAGLNLGEIASSFSGSVHDAIQVQPSILDVIEWKDVAFRPSDTIVDAIDRFYKSNWARPTSERLRFHETDISASDYTFMVPKDQKEPIYTRHPISGVVTKHEHPFNTLPRFSLSAHPVFVIAHAYGMLLWHGNASDKIQQIGRNVTRSVKEDFLQVQVPLPSTKTPLASLFRSRTTSSFSATSRSPEDSRRKRRRQCEVPSGVIEWVDQIRVVAFDELPQDDLVLYSSEPSKPYATVVECDQAWLAVVERKEKRRQLGV